MKLLLLGGSGEARDIAECLATQSIPAVLSLSGNARILPGEELPNRVGGFGGEAGFRAYLAREGITAVLDATHPFANTISHRTARICAELDLPYCQVLRPPWTPAPGERWICIDRPEEAAQHIPEGATVFMATGRDTLERFSNLAGRRVICRQIVRHEGPFPFAGGRFLFGDPPFSVGDERALFKSLRVEWLILKNAGGVAPRTKVTAAGELGIPTILLNRPAPPDAYRVETVAAALEWVAAL